MNTVPSRFLPACAWMRAAFLLQLLAALVALSPDSSGQVATQRETGTVSITQTSSAAWKKVYFANPFAATPVVVTGPASYNDSARTTVRLRNINSKSFEIQIDEWDNLDGVHGEEKVSWLALQVGVHDIAGKKWQAGLRTGVNTAAVDVTLTNSYTAPPIILASLATATNARAVIPRVATTTNTVFALRIRAQESYTSALSSETIGYVAVEAGAGTVDGRAYLAGTMGVTNAFTAQALNSNLVNATFLATSQTLNNNDPFAIRMRKLSTSAANVEIALEEEQSLDTEVVHPTETVGYLALAKLPGEEKAKFEYGTIDLTQADSGVWSTEMLDNSYSTPVVVFGPVSYQDGTPATVRVKVGMAATTNSFQYRIDEWTGQNGHGPETLGYLVMEAGDYEIAGLRWKAARLDTVTFAESTIPFTPTFPAAPVVFTQVVTKTDETTVSERLRDITATGFKVRLTKGESSTATTHLGAAIHYLAIQRGSGRLAGSGLLLLAASSSNNVTHLGQTETFSRKIVDPVLLGDIQTFADPDPVFPRATNLYESSVHLRVQEENTDADPETAHGNEIVSYLALATALDLDEDGMADAWETLHGVSDPADDPDQDGQTNLLEYRYRTLPNAPDTATIAFAVEILDPTKNPAGDAFEHSDSGVPIAARVRVSRTGSGLPMTVNFTLSGTAIRPGFTGADYQTTTTGGTVLNGSITLPYNSNTAYIVLQAIADATPEYPETVTVSLAPNTGGTSGGRYSGMPSVASVKIKDATDTPLQNQTFVAFLTPTGSNVGSGIGTLILNGPKTEAKVSLAIHSLGASQTDAFLLYGRTATSGQALRDPFPLGNFAELPWNIPDPGYPLYSGQQIVDALHQVVDPALPNDNKWIYIDVGVSATPTVAAHRISGKWRAQSGSVAFVEPDPAPPITKRGGDALTREVARFLTQATFGPTKGEIDALEASVGKSATPTIPATGFAGDRIAAFSAWIDTQLAYDQTKLYEYARAADLEEWPAWGVTDINTANYPTSDPLTNPNNESISPSHYNRIRGWWTISTKARDQLRQRIAFALSEIFVTSTAETTVKIYHLGQCHYYDMLGSYATGNFRDLLEEVSLHPIMGQYLSSLKNEKTLVDNNGTPADTTDDKILASPDENYAREVMQLFSIGLVKRHLDGSLMLSGATGAAIPTYGNEDITDLARVFTGWSFGQNNGIYDPQGTGTRMPPILANLNSPSHFQANTASRFHQSNWMASMKNFPAFHDTGPKVVLGQSVDAGLTGEADLDRALDIIFNHPNVAPFISRLLIQRLVTSNPSPGYIYRVAQKFTNNGSGVRGDMKAVIKAILLDYEARTLSVADQNHFGKQKEPLIRHVQLLRALDGKSSMPLANLRPASDPGKYGYPAAQLDNFPPGTTRYRYPYTGSVLGQAPLWAPSVFNWFLPDYSPGGVISAAGLVAPEMQLTTESSVVTIINYQHPLIRYPVGQNVDELYQDPPLGNGHPDDDVKLDLTSLGAVYNATVGTNTAKVTAALDYLDLVLCAGDLKTRYPVVTGPVDNPREFILDAIVRMAVLSGVTPETLMRDLLYLVATSPTCIHQK